MEVQSCAPSVLLAFHDDEDAAVVIAMLSWLELGEFLKLGVHLEVLSGSVSNLEDTEDQAWTEPQLER